MVKNKALKSIRKKKDIFLLKKKGHSFSSDWIRAAYFRNDEQGLYVAWSLPKKYIPRAVDRNRLRRWGRENLKEGALIKGQALMMFLPKEKDFYKKLKREGFNNVFENIMDKIYKKFK